MGLPLAGKTKQAKQLAKHTNLHHVDIDVGPGICIWPQEKESYQTEDARKREALRMKACYHLLHETVHASLNAGRSIIISATYASVIGQDTIQAVTAAHKGAVLKTIWCAFNDSPEEVQRRIERRLALGEPGGVNSVDQYFQNRARFNIPRHSHLFVNTSEFEEGSVPPPILQYIEQ